MYNEYNEIKRLIINMIKNEFTSLDIISPPYYSKNIQHFFKFVYTFSKKYGKIFILCI